MSLAENAAPGFRDHPGYEVNIAKAGQRVRIVFNGETVADSDAALLVLETRHRPVYYLPMANVRRDLLQPSAHGSYCPFKGKASYWSIVVGERVAENAVWGYEAPFAEVAPLKDHVAFYGDRVDAVYLDGALQEAVGPGYSDS